LSEKEGDLKPTPPAFIVMLVLVYGSGSY